MWAKTYDLILFMKFLKRKLHRPLHCSRINYQCSDNSVALLYKYGISKI